MEDKDLCMQIAKFHENQAKLFTKQPIDYESFSNSMRILNGDYSISAYNKYVRDFYASFDK